MLDDNIKSVSSIKRQIDSPTIIDSTIKEDCLFENTIMEGFGTIIIDKTFIDEMLTIINEKELPNNFIELLTFISNKAKDYFYSSNKNDKSREDTYANSYVLNDEGQVIGTKLSSLKGKNVALCSEKSIAAFVILENLHRKGKISRKPSIVLSTLRTESSPSEPHAFILIDNEEDRYPTKHILYDVQNPSLIENKLGRKINSVGLYSLSDEQYHNIINGIECTPLSLFEVLSPELHDVGEKRIYGTVKLNKSL